MDRIAGELSHHWVERVLEALVAQDRSLEGGWPGTTSEARQIAIAWLRGQPVSPALAAVQREQLEQLGKAVYDGAKKQWLALASR
ncbi:MAG TPA: hypothetical protein VML75_10380 [Kofleriaceae bacterium]|nr:hypothetical protein [Kofleriaceae bacterium]